ncbi:hypothetical protein GCM10009664_66510 [Kitasatospora gansuensis]
MEVAAWATLLVNAVVAIAPEAAMEAARAIRTSLDAREGMAELPLEYEVQASEWAGRASDGCPAGAAVGAA